MTSLHMLARRGNQRAPVGRCTARWTRRCAAVWALAVAGCAPTAPAPTGPAAADGPGTSAMAWLALQRPVDPQLARRMARVHLDDRALTALAAGERRRVAVPTGRHRVAVDLWDEPGQCEVEFDLAAGQTVMLRVSPRHGMADADATGCSGAFRVETAQAAR
ncbi:MAG: hypothetical protein KF683_15475 [Rubrivivax sp.]|nr:hypothetical protein [Rubrivivax sp.]